MATNLALDPKLLDQVLELSDEQTKKAAVTLALKAFIARHEQRKLAELFGKLVWDHSYDYKAEPTPPNHRPKAHSICTATRSGACGRACCNSARSR
jgi:hypothetical protein